jgi:hypothetical protein
MPCNPLDVNLDLPSGPGGPSIPGFGLPFALKVPGIPFPEGIPEDLLELFDKLKLLIPPGALKPALNPNFGKDIFDSIMKLLDQFLPFLMLYKFFLPILNLIICIIEVLCAIPNPFKMIRAMKRLFRNCLPDFLNLFPIFALIIMLISLLLLLLALIEYIIQQILKFIKALLRNIRALGKAFNDADEGTVLSIARKLGSLICVFQNIFVLLALFAVIIQVIKDILNLSFAIPPCDDGDAGDNDGCCTTDVCPEIVKNQYVRTTGTLQYLNKVSVLTDVVMPAPYNEFTVEVRKESVQLFDTLQLTSEQFRNIFDASDVTYLPKPIFFPTDGTYTALTAPRHAAYTVDLKLFYNPANWNRVGKARYIKFKDCIVTKVPTETLDGYDNSTSTITTGVITIAGGKGYENDGTTILTGFDVYGITPISSQATIENFLHRTETVSLTPVLTDGYTFENVEYTFKPNMETLLSKNIVTLGCEPSMALNKVFINGIFAGDVGVRTQLLQNLVNSSGTADNGLGAGNTDNGGTSTSNISFPDPAGAQLCLETALSALRSNLTIEGVADFQTTANICLQKLKDDTNDSLGALIGIGAEPCKSSFTLTPLIQFTSKTIKIKVDINERNGLPLTSGISDTVATNLAARLKAYVTFGEASAFRYDGIQSFESEISSIESGSGEVMISFDDNMLCNNIIPADNTIDPIRENQVISYNFVYVPTGATAPVIPGTTGDLTDGTQPRRDSGDIATDGNTGKDGS